MITATVRGTSLYDVTVELDDKTIDAQCACPYEGAGNCKHVVAVLLDVIVDPPRDESERVDGVIEVSRPMTYVRSCAMHSPKTQTCVSSSSHGLATAASRSKSTVTR